MVIINIFCPYSGHHCPHSGHQKLMSGIRSVLLSIFWISTFDVLYMDRENCPYSGHQLMMSGTSTVEKNDAGMRTVMSGIGTMMSGTWTVITGIWTVMSGIWTENISDVQNMASFPCPYSGHDFLMSGIWPVFTVHIPDIKF